MNWNVREALRTSLPWRAGWPFNVGVGLFHSHAAGPALRFRALNTPGDLAPIVSPAPWTFHLGLAARPVRPLCAVRSDSFLIEFPWDGHLCQALGIMVAPGVLAGVTDAPLVPTLFSGTHQVHRAANAEWLATDTEHVVLVRNNESNLVRFVLAAGVASRSILMQRAQTALDVDLHSAFEEGIRWRTTAYSSFQNTPFGTDVLCIEAFESLLARLELPSQQIPHTWCATELTPQASCDVDQLFLLTAAWTPLDSAIAEEIIRAVLSLQRHDGAIPHRFYAGGAADYARPPIPLLAQSVAQLVRQTGRHEIIRSVLPGLQSYLSWVLNHYSPEFEQERTEMSIAMLPEKDDDERGSLALLLLAEIETLQELGHFVGSPLQGIFWSESERIRSFLESHPWMQLAQAPAETRSGHHVERPKVSPLLALRSRFLPESFRETVLTRWEHHIEEITETSSFSCNDAVLLLATLLERNASATATRLSAALWRKVQERIQQEAVQAPPSRPAGRGAVVPLAADLSATIVYVSTPHTVSDQRSKSRVSRLFAWAEEQSAAAIALLLLVPTLAIAAIIVGSLSKKTPPISHFEISLGLAQSFYQLGQYDKAIAVYEEIIHRSGRMDPFMVMLGNAYFRAGDLQNAEKCYRTAVERNQQTPSALLNLALTLYRQGRLEESSELYARFIEEYGSQYPNSAIRARTALHLLQQRVAETNKLLRKSSIM